VADVGREGEVRLVGTIGVDLVALDSCSWLVRRAHGRAQTFGG
jgi:hypothetical protein